MADPLPKTIALTLTKTQGTEISINTFELRPDGEVWITEEYNGRKLPAVIANEEWIRQWDTAFRFHYDVAISLLKRWFETWSD